jgi:plastocyanin
MANRREIATVWLGAGLLVGLTACEPGQVEAPPSSSGGPQGAGSTGTASPAGGGADDVAPASDPGAWAVALQPSSAQLSLGGSSTVQVGLRSTGYQGQVSLALAGLPAGWTATLQPPGPVTLGTAAVSVSLTVQVPGLADAGTVNLTIAGTAGGVQKTAALAVAVDNTLEVPIAAGTGVGNHAFGAIAARVGTRLRIVNRDSVEHQIHAGNGDAGLSHGDSMAPGEAYEATLQQAGTFEVYCHDHGEEAGVAVIEVQQ